MVLSNVVRVVNRLNSAGTRSGLMGIRQLRRKYTYRSGALKPMPNVIPFGLLGVVLTVIPGLLIGATISKNMANFLEENDLFVPSDDDDDDD
ncbi:AAEL003858-PA [Aedes aegypti]|uniref:Essential MCU regulator, mitochondrial n=1 Tax=Aedes aegypti TaxID=7159 RepID=EMRE_AEDAE|nr:essential MCU regulator, mitochondrial [Aedes aegypti]Q17ED3.1 RecName: Full=Essential MCU regulator, mitochondrial; Flags: Precursor [Aedes aegypti]EAT44843.1 AAEL003858-PA [Aedes aegypti]